MAFRKPIEAATDTLWGKNPILSTIVVEVFPADVPFSAAWYRVTVSRGKPVFTRKIDGNYSLHDI
jgi:hypothetical protein